MAEKFAGGSEDSVSYRGVTIRVWRTSLDHGRGRSIERRWYTSTLPRHWFKSKEDALTAAKREINFAIDGPMTVDKLEAQFASWFGSIFEDELQEPQPRAFEIDPKQQALEALREKLRSIRVDRGASAAEEETAKKKLADLNRRSG